MSIIDFPVRWIDRDDTDTIEFIMNNHKFIDRMRYPADFVDDCPYGHEFGCIVGGECWAGRYRIISKADFCLAACAGRGFRWYRPTIFDL